MATKRLVLRCGAASTGDFLQLPLGFFVGLDVPPDLAAAVFAMAANMHPTVVSSPVAGADSAEGVGGNRSMFARHTINVR